MGFSNTVVSAFVPELDTLKCSKLAVDTDRLEEEDEGEAREEAQSEIALGRRDSL